MFSKDYHVGFSRVDVSGKAKHFEVVNMLQDCSTDHTDSLGMKCLDLKKSKHAWFIYLWHIVFDDRPCVGDYVEVSTWPYEFKSFFGMRNYTMKNPEGKVIVCADSYWVYYDFDKNTVVVPDEEVRQMFELDERYPMERVPRKIKMPKETEHVGEETVRGPSLDTNEHMNNAEYIRIASGYLDYGTDIKELFVEYVNSAKLGNKMIIFRKDEGEFVYIRIENEEGSIFVNVKFRINME